MRIKIRCPACGCWHEPPQCAGVKNESDAGVDLAITYMTITYMNEAARSLLSRGEFPNGDSAMLYRGNRVAADRVQDVLRLSMFTPFENQPPSAAPSQYATSQEVSIRELKEASSPGIVLLVALKKMHRELQEYERKHGFKW